MGCGHSRIKTLLVPSENPHECTNRICGRNIKVFGAETYEDGWRREREGYVIKIGEPITFARDVYGNPIETEQYIYGKASGELLGFLQICQSDIPKKNQHVFRQPEGATIGESYDGIRMYPAKPVETLTVYYRGRPPSARPP
jgi:hypothetical protein